MSLTSVLGVAIMASHYVHTRISTVNTVILIANKTAFQQNFRLFIMSAIDYLGYSFGSVVYLSGLAGFIIEKNRMSLALGTVFGLLALLGAHQATDQPQEPLIAIANAGAFSSVQIFRNIKQFKTGNVSCKIQVRRKGVIVFI